MRAINLQITAFGPYLERQEIDFNQLGNEAIFLITGPTGAGKTTIFDAICYALYGRASGSDRDQDTLRSHFAGKDEQTEIVFRFALGTKVYEVIRHPKQLKKKARGDGYTDEPAKAELYEITEFEKVLLSARIKEVNEAIEEKLGFDYEQFRKMVLIPQGEFRKLISENSKEREAILQKIFRTYFYEKITEQLKDDAKELKVDISKIEQLIQLELTKLDFQYEVLASDASVKEIMAQLEKEINQMVAEISEKQAEKLKQEVLLQQAEEALHKGKLLHEKYSERDQLKVEQVGLEATAHTIAEKQLRLKQAERAEAVIPFENQQLARKAEWELQKQKFVQQQQVTEQQKQRYAETKIVYAEEEAKAPVREQLKEEIRVAEVQLEKVRQLIGLHTQAKGFKQTAEAFDQELAQLGKQIATQEQDLEAIEVKLATEQDSTGHFYETKGLVKDAEDKLKLLKNLEAEFLSLTALRKRYRALQVDYKAKQAELVEVKGHYEALEVRQKEQYAGFLAQQLQSGASCPVCGSLEHPNKSRIADSDDVTNEMIEAAKEIVLRKEAEFSAVQETFSQCKVSGEIQGEMVQKLADPFKDEIAELEEVALQQLINKQIENIATLQAVFKKAEQDQQLLTELKAKNIKSKQQLTELKQVIDGLSQKAQGNKDAMIKIQVQIEGIEADLPKDILDLESFQAYVADRTRLYEKAIADWESIKLRYEADFDAFKHAETTLTSLEGFRADKEVHYQQQLQAYVIAVDESGFETEESYRQAKYSKDAQKQLKDAIELFNKRLEQIVYRLDELQQQIGTAACPNLIELTEAQEQIKSSIGNITEAIHTLLNKQQMNTHIQLQVQSHLEKLKALDDQYYVIGDLADLAYGNNDLRLSFERYVLASFLDEILLQANVRLDKMTDYRYTLIRSGQIAKRGAQSGLDLEIIDQHTGVQRSVKTLSGGEGFKTALCLALGLADVVQAHAGGVQLDTLFIDEGFGTLDEISLQQAIDCLKDLEDSNRLLGIISHVPQLKQEIHAKLQISATSKGSTLEFVFGQS